MYRIVLTFILMLATSTVAASPESIFSEIENTRKGPFGYNYLQGTRGRSKVLSGAPSGDFLFQAAYRNEVAETLATEHGFYTGNLFTTNYYNLMSETIFDGAQSFSLDHEALMSVGASRMSESVEIVKHWVLEKYYISKFPDSGITRGFNTRGIAGSEFEQEYANYYFSYYLSFVEDSFQFLPVYLLAKQSPITNSSSLEKSRDMIKVAYDYFVNRWGASDSRVRGLYKIRNAIHNNLSENVLPMIEIYLEENPWYAANGNTYLQEIHRMLSEYFQADAGKIKELANASGLTDLVGAAQTVEEQGVSVKTLFLLSQTAVESKKALSTSAVAWTKKAKALATIVSATDFINKEVIKFEKVESSELAQTLLNLIFIEGFLIEDNWAYFYDELSSGDSEALSSTLVDVIDVAAMTMDDVFLSTVTAWSQASGQSGVQQFRDDVLKSSSLNSVSVILNKGN